MIASRLCTPPLPAPPPSPAEDGDSIQPTERLSRSRRDVGEPDKYWPQHSTLKIAMYDYEMDDPYVQAVKQAASEWLPHINLKFEFVSGEEGDVRISGVPIHQGSGVSMVGTDAQKVSPGMPTMNLPIDYSSTSFAHTVLHEFGHMLGARHAHQHPDANIPWDLAKLDRHIPHHYQQANLLPLPRSAVYDFLPYDEDSAMHYAINPALTTSNTFHSRNLMLSPGDIAWANKAYPKAARRTGT